MPMTRCPHCSTLMLVNRDLVDEPVGCMRCSRLFCARLARFVGPLERAWRWAVVLSASYLTYVWWSGQLMG